MLKVRSTETGGRSYFATRSIPSDTLILVDSPTIATIYDDFKKEVCVYCYKYAGGTSMKVLLGKSSRACSESCRSSFMALPGSVELQQLWDSIQHAKKSLGELINYDLLRFCAAAIIAAKHSPDQYAELLSLQDDYAMITSTERQSESGVCMAIRQISPDCSPHIEVLLKQMIGRSKCNCFGIWEQELEVSFPESEMFGYALYTHSSFFNHSCRPNVSKLRVGREMHFRTTVEIQSDEELAISYLGDREYRDLAERQSALTEWGFHCNCSLCLSETLPS